MKILNFIFYSFFVVLLLAVVALFFVPQLPIANNIALKIVESGSMEPAIMTGSLVVVRPVSIYKEGDVITFESAQANVPTTHRILAVREANGEKFFMTKGDANEEADTEEVALRSVLGKVVVSIPYVGFILDFARQPLGFMLLIVVPASLIILSEIDKIWHEMRNRRRSNKVAVQLDDNGENKAEKAEYIPVSNTASAPKVRMIEIACPMYIKSSTSTVSQPPPAAPVMAQTMQPRQYVLSTIIILFSVCIAGMGFTGTTVSYLYDIEATLGNFLKTSQIDFMAFTENPLHAFIALDDTVTFTTTITPDAESLVVDYTVHVEKMAGDDILCAAILATVSTPIAYDGSLLGLSETGVIFGESWDLSLALDPLLMGYAAGSTCLVDVVYTAWYKDGPAGVGYFDTERVPLTLSTLMGNELPPTVPLFEREMVVSSKEFLMPFEETSEEFLGSELTDDLPEEEHVPVNPDNELDVLTDEQEEVEVIESEAQEEVEEILPE